MGGYGSGRPALRAVMDGARRFDIRRLRRPRGLGSGMAGVWTWTRDGEPNGHMRYRISDDAIELRYTITEDQPEDVLISVALRFHPCRYGGKRGYLLCPHCSRTCEVIVMTTDGRRWGCRKCLRLRYQSQRLAPADRIQRRAHALYDRAGTDYGDGMVLKRKWMRWRTFNRLMDRANALDGAADAAFLYRMRRFAHKELDDLLR